MTTFANGESGLSVRTKINNVLQHADGTAGELVINEAGADVDFRVESDTNANALFVDGATGNVGVGTSSPAQELEIAGTEPNIRLNSGGTPSALYGFEITNGTTVDAYLRTRGSTGETQLGSGRSAGWGGHLTFYTDTSERMRITAAGNVGIGTSSPAAKLVVNNATALASVPAVGSKAGLFVATVGAQDYGLISGALNDGSYFFQSQATEGTLATYPILLNPNGGSVRIGTTSSSAFPTQTTGGSTVLQMGLTFSRSPQNASGRYWYYGSEEAAGATYVIYNNNNTGVYLAYGGTSWTANSDERMKTTLVPFEDAVGKVCSLRAGTGRYLTDEENVSRSFLIAQDVQAVLPEAVDVMEDEQGTLGLRYSDVVPLLVAAIKELKAEVDSLRAQLNP